MKRLLLPLLATIALPTSVNAENVFLLIKSQAGKGYKNANITSFVIPMASMERCEEAGAKIIASQRFDTPEGRHDGFECVIGQK